MSKFKVFIDTPTDTNCMSAESFSADSQIKNGFRAGTSSSAIRVNSALRQANLVTAALMNIVDTEEELDLRSDVSSVETKINSYFDNKYFIKNIDKVETENFAEDAVAPIADKTIKLPNGYGNFEVSYGLYNENVGALNANYLNKNHSIPSYIRLSEIYTGSADYIDYEIPDVGVYLYANILVTMYIEGVSGSHTDAIFNGPIVNYGSDNNNVIPLNLSVIRNSNTNINAKLLSLKAEIVGNKLRVYRNKVLTESSELNMRVEIGNVSVTTSY